MPDDRTTTDAPPGGAAAIVRAMSVLGCFGPEDDELGIGEIAERTELRVSTAHRIVRALCSGAFMEQDPRSDRYRLGRALVPLGQRAAEHLGLEAARPVLEDLATRTGESVSLGVRHGDEVVVLLVASSTQRLRFDHEQGGRIGLHASAMGKALLAFGPVPLDDAVPAEVDLEAYTSHTITDRAALLADLADARACGYATNLEGRFDGVVGVAAPIPGPDRVVTAAVGVQGPTTRLGPERLGEVGAQVQQAAARLAELPVLRRL